MEALTPGVYSLAAERYHAATGVSKSQLDILAEGTPAHLKACVDGEARHETPAMTFGTILHRACLEPDTYKDAFHTRPDKLSFATKEGKVWRDAHADKIVMTANEARAIDRMVSAVHRHPFAKALLTGAQTEQSLFVNDEHGTLRKSRLDALTKGNIIPDIKTVESASDDAMSRSISNYRYHVQGAYYIDNCRLAGFEKDWFFLICIEKNAPYLVRCLRLEPSIIAYGRRLYERDLETYRKCAESGVWHGWEETWRAIELPSYEMRQLETA